MTYDVIICDWNGTLIASRDEKGIMESIARDYAKASFPWHPSHLARLLRVRKELQTLYRNRRRDDDFDYVIEMFRVFNEHIVSGLPVDFVNRSLERNASSKRTIEKLDQRLLRIIDNCHRHGMMTGILSAGFIHSIQFTLKAAGFDTTFDFCEANVLKQENGLAIGFDLSIYRRKLTYLRELLRQKNIHESRVVYIGDSEDDAECFEFVGYPVMPFLASPELKEQYARKYRAFVPRDEDDLAAYLGIKSV